MHISDKSMRSIAFFGAVILFFAMLPILLSYSLGYKIDYKNLKIYKTGIIFLNTRPAGASVYVNGRLIKDLTPAQVEELKPGRYKIIVKLEDFYPWEGELDVKPNRVTKADKIELFPVSKEVKRIGKVSARDFVVSDTGLIYYLTGDGLYVSGTDGNGLKKISSYSDWPDKIVKKKFSPDKNKFLYFDDRSVYIVYLAAADTKPDSGQTAGVENVFNSPDHIVDVFWYPGYYYIVVVSDSDIKVVELRGGQNRNVVSLYKFVEQPRFVYYDQSNDSLYFMDELASPGVSAGKYLYRLGLRQTFFDSIKQLLIKEKPKEDDKEQ
jgi:hypothetical protein